MRTYGWNYLSYVIRLVKRAVQKEVFTVVIILDVVFCIAIIVSLAGCYQLLREPRNIIGRLHDHIRQRTTI